MTSRGTPAICFDPIGNIDSTYHFLSLVSGLVIKRCCLDELPALESVISCISELAVNSGVPKNFIFTNRCCVPCDWPEDNLNELDDNPIAAYLAIPAHMLGMLIN